MSGTNFFEFREKLTARRADAPVEASALTSPQPTPLTVSQLTAQIDRAIRSGISG
jgi:hypothetical protein